MKNLRRCYLAFISSVFFCLLSLSLCLSCEAATTYQITEEQLQTLENHLSELESNNQRLSAILNEQKQELTQARSLSQKQSTELKALRNRLNEVLSEIATAKQSLQTANDELASANKSLQQYESKARLTKRQRTLWQVLTILAVGAGITAAAS